MYIISYTQEIIKKYTEIKELAIHALPYFRLCINIIFHLKNSKNNNYTNI